MERVLRVLGPIATDSQNLFLEADSVLESLQYEVELNYDQTTNQPKQILSIVLENLINSLTSLSGVELVALLSELQGALTNKEIQVFMNDRVVQQQLRAFGWTGEIVPAQKNQDYLMIVNTNLHGLKSDARIKQAIKQRTQIQADGTIVNTVTVGREHTGNLGEQFYGVNNVSYLRIYVPEGAELLNAGGFTFPPEDIFQVPEAWYAEDEDVNRLEQEQFIHNQSGTRITREFGKTVFGNWIMVAPGNTSEVYFTYRLPFKVFSLSDSNDGTASRYSLLLQKQSGVDSQYDLDIQFPSSWEPVWQIQDDVDVGVNSVEWKTRLETDQVFGVVMKKIR